MLPDHIYASMKRDEVWDRGELLEQRSESGYAHTMMRDGRIQIVATDDFGAESELEKRLIAAFTTTEAELIRRIAGTRRIQIVTIARVVRNHRLIESSCSTVATIDINGSSVTTTADKLEMDLKQVEERNDHRDFDAGDLPMVWRNGSGSVLLHEAVGHPAERGISAEWPEWLTVRDEPADRIDDTGQETSIRDLTRGESPSAFRRTDFRSVPIRRMSKLRVSSNDMDADLPSTRLEISSVSEGTFDPLTDEVRVNIHFASLVEKGRRQTVQPFVFIARRSDLPRRLAGARGPRDHYRGTICSDEGQRLYVGGFSPDLLILPLQ